MLVVAFLSLSRYFGDGRETVCRRGVGTMEETFCCPRCWGTVSDGDKTCPSCGAEGHCWVRGPLAGKTLAGGKYRLLEPLGSGGFGCTAKALQIFGGRSLGSEAAKFPLYPDGAVTPG